MNVRDAAKLAAHVAMKTAPIPILAHLRVNAGRIMATDSVQQLEMPIELHGAAAKAAFCVHGARLAKILKALPDDLELDFALRDRRLFLVAGNTRYELNTLPVEDFPVMEQEPDPLAAITLPSEAFVAALQFVRPAMAVEDVRHFLIGIHLAADGAHLRATATDGHRLHTMRIEVEVPAADAATCAGIIPASAVDAVISVAARHNTVAIQINPRRLLIDDRETLSLKLIDASYPAIDRVIPRTRPVTGSIERKPAIAALERVATILGARDHSVVELGFQAGSAVEISARNGDGERAATSIPWAAAGPLTDTPGFAAGFKAPQLIDALAAMPGDTVFLHLGAGASDALYFTDDSDGTREIVVMPMRL